MAYFETEGTARADLGGLRGTRSSTALPSAPDLYARVGKRALDIAISLLVLPLAVPVIAVLWALVRLDGGPGFFRQPRIGRHGRRFTCLKIRTMAVDADRRLQRLIASDPELAAEWARDQKLARDPRVTRIGAFARATSLDELPQLFNVLRGELSLVGPRPFTVEQEGLYRAAGGHGYYQLRPGLTGPWQVEGRGATTFLDRIAFDNAYARDLGLWRDLGLILRTVQAVLARTGS